MEIKFYKKKFITSGIADYKDCDDGVILIQKPAIDNALKTIIGKPVIITHDGKEPVGEVVDAYFSAENDAFICGFNVWDKEAQNLLDNKGYSVSCTYEVSEYNGGGIYHNINYDKEAVAIDFKNLAIVDTPRYQEAKEYVNSINNNNEKDDMFFSKKENECDKLKNEVRNEEDVITFRGKSITPEELIRVIFEEADFHKGKPVDDKTEFAEEEQEAETVKNDEVDKRKDIDEVGGFLKSKGLNDEDIRYVMKLMEQASYNDSEAGTRDNSIEEGDEAENGGIGSGFFGHLGRPGIVGGSSKIKGVHTTSRQDAASAFSRGRYVKGRLQEARNDIAEEQQKAGEDELKKDIVKDDEKVNAIKRPILNAIMNSQNQEQPAFLSRHERIAEANKKYSL